MAKSPPVILMLGTHFETMGGISTVVNVYREYGLFEQNHILYVPTHCDGSGKAKASIAVQAFFRAFWILISRPVGLVHIHVSSRASFWRKSLFIGLAHLFRKRIIFHLHGSEFREFFDHELHGWRRWLALRILNSPACIIALSEAWATWLASRTSQPRIVVLRNSIMPLQLPAAHPATPPAVLFLGRIGTRKGTFDLLQAARQVAAKQIDFQLILCGDGEVETARALAAEYGLKERVSFPGWIKAQQKLDLLATASIYTLPSYDEGQPMSILEAMSAGLPVLSTPVGGIPEQIRDGEEGFLVQAGDVTALAQALERLLTDSELRQQLGSQARIHFNEAFSAPQVLPQLQSLYQQLMASP